MATRTISTRVLLSDLRLVDGSETLLQMEGEARPLESAPTAPAGEQSVTDTFPVRISGITARTLLAQISLYHDGSRRLSDLPALPCYLGYEERSSLCSPFVPRNVSYARVIAPRP